MGRVLAFQTVLNSHFSDCGLHIISQVLYIYINLFSVDYDCAILNREKRRGI